MRDAPIPPHACAAGPDPSHCAMCGERLDCTCVFPNPRENWNVCWVCKRPCDHRYVLQGRHTV